MKRIGFTLIELMIVVAIIAFLAIIAVPSFSKFLAKAKRSEAYMQLNSIYAAQKAYHAEHGRYAKQLSGPKGLGWKPEGYKGGGEQEQFYYTYGFGNGAEGTHYFTGKLNTPSSNLAQARAGDNSFLILAAGEINGKGKKADILAVDENGAITILQDALE
jgi:prepilin-type N-terminal cleavage/methylation domain-containing protein